MAAEMLKQALQKEVATYQTLQQGALLASAQMRAASYACDTAAGGHLRLVFAHAAAEMSKLVTTRTQLQSQVNENEMVLEVHGRDLQAAAPCSPGMACRSPAHATC